MSKGNLDHDPSVAGSRPDPEYKAIGLRVSEPRALDRWTKVHVA